MFIVFQSLQQIKSKTVIFQYSFGSLRLLMNFTSQLSSFSVFSPLALDVHVA